MRSALVIPFKVWSSLVWIALAGTSLLGLTPVQADPGRSLALVNQGERPKLIVSNQFESPESVLRHYCARDAWGFIWSGMMQAELRALTQWKFAPQTEGFQVIQGYSFGTTQVVSPSEVSIPVTYQVLGVGQASGAFVPLDTEALQHARTQTVRYRLRKINGRWKIVSPEPTQIEPRVLVEYSPARPAASGTSAPIPSRLRDLQ